MNPFVSYFACLRKEQAKNHQVEEKFITFTIVSDNIGSTDFCYAIKSHHDHYHCHRHGHQHQFHHQIMSMTTPAGLIKQRYKFDRWNGSENVGNNATTHRKYNFSSNAALTNSSHPYDSQPKPPARSSDRESIIMLDNVVTAMVPMPLESLSPKLPIRKRSTKVDHDFYLRCSDDDTSMATALSSFSLITSSVPKRNSMSQSEIDANHPCSSANTHIEYE
jgi:hypothetical protein